MSKKRALISVFDKTGIVDFARKLHELDWEIISTGGTSKLLKTENIPTIDISDVTGFPECFDGRVKTLHPKLHGGFLAIRDNVEHQKMMAELEIEPIDLVVCNLYPFRETVSKKDASHEEIIENIDIGGPSMLRAASKNYRFVTVITDIKDYEKVLNELKEKNETSLATREYLAGKVFHYTAAYDTLIAGYFAKHNNEKFPDKITFTFDKKQEMRYGENPHQKASFYTDIFETEGSLSQAEQLHGKELSYNNINDANGAIELLKEFDEPTIVAIKHANPCGVGSSANLVDACRKAYESDRVSIFGGIVAANRQLDEATAKILSEIFLEVVIAPSFSDEALKILSAKKNIRLLQLSNIEKNNYKSLQIKKVTGGLLVQERDDLLLDEQINYVTEKRPTEKEMQNLLFAMKVVKHAKSNAIVLAKDLMTIGIGNGQTSRIWALENAVKQAGENAKNAVLASDAFFPFSDCVELAAANGITAIIQPGGSMRDKDSIEAANKFGIAMIFTGMRHFKH